MIDFHTHTFPERIAAGAISKLQSASRTAAFTDGTDAGLLRSMALGGIDRSVILPVATNPAKLSSMNDSILRAPTDERLIRFGAMHPLAPDWRAQLDLLAAHGVRGVKLHPVYQDVNIDDPRSLRVLERAGELGLIVVMHAGDDIGFPGVVRCSPAMTARALRQVGPVSLVLAHMGGWRNWDEAAMLASFANVRVDTAFSLGHITPLKEGSFAPQQTALLAPQAFCRLARLFGTDRVLFGTDSPWMDQARSLRRLLALPLTRQEQRQILHDNASRLLNG